MTATCRGTRLSNDWKPVDDDLTFAASHNVNVQLEADKFRDYWIAIPGAKGRKLDWSATWRNWIRKAETDHARPGRKETTPQRLQREWEAIERERRENPHEFGDEGSLAFLGSVLRYPMDRH